MKYEEKFLNKLYDTMVQNKIITEQSKPTDLKDKLTRLKKYLSRLENMINNIAEPELKRFIYDSYIIKETDIPSQYYERKIKEISTNTTLDTKTAKEKIAKELISDQKSSLDKWIDYFKNKEGSKYSYSLKCWAFMGMLNLGNYDTDNQTFERRSKSTISNFVDLNVIAITQTLQTMNNYLTGEKIKDPKLLRILEGYNFGNLYAYYFSIELEQQKANFDGKWIKYEKDSDPSNLVESLEGMGTNWCITAYYDAKGKLELGPIYIYYTKNSEGDYKVPRLAIRLESDDIVEIKGIAKGQNIETNMEQVVASKLSEFSNARNYLNQLNDMNKLTIISRKNEKNIELTREELIFIYEIDRNIQELGNRQDPRIDKIISTRNKKKDLAIIFGCKEENIACNLRELIENPTRIICFYGDINARYLKDFNCDFANLVCIVGNFIWKDATEIKGFEKVEVITKNIDCPNLRKSIAFESLEKVGGKVDFSSLEELESMTNLNYIGGNLYIPNKIWEPSLDNRIKVNGTKFLIDSGRAKK